jgi:hypothetical protein
MGESIISTCMNPLSKTKDSIKARKDLGELYNHRILELSESSGMPCGLFCLKPK